MIIEFSEEVNLEYTNEERIWQKRGGESAMQNKYMYEIFKE